MVALAGFLYGSRGDIDAYSGLLGVGGLALVIASACVVNNYIDRGIDARMCRTKKRALVTRSIPVKTALGLALVLAAVGFGMLYALDSTVALWVALIGFTIYIGLYGYLKRRTVHGTLVGALAGATPPVVGYSAATGQLDTAAIILFTVLVAWQMPHFYAIAITRMSEYKAAHIPVMPLVKGIATTKTQMRLYGMGFAGAATCMFVYDKASYSYLVVMLATSLWWSEKINSRTPKDDKQWSKSVFKSSLTVLMVFSFMISIDYFLP